MYTVHFINTKCNIRKAKWKFHKVQCWDHYYILVRHQIAVKKQRATCMLMIQKGANKESTIA